MPDRDVEKTLQSRTTPVFRVPDDNIISAKSAKRKYRSGWITDEMKTTGWFVREPTNFRYSLLRRVSESPPQYEEVASVAVPSPIAHAYGRLKKWLDAE